MVTFFESERYRFVSLFLCDEFMVFRVRFCGIIFGWCTRYLMLLPPRAPSATLAHETRTSSRIRSTRTLSAQFIIRGIIVPHHLRDRTRLIECTVTSFVVEYTWSSALWRALYSPPTITIKKHYHEFIARITW